MNRYSGTKTKGVSSASGTWVSAGDRPDTRKRKLNPPGDPYWSTVAAETATRTAADPPDGPEHAESMQAQLGVDKNVPKVDLAAYEAADAKPKATDRSQTTVDPSTNFASARSMSSLTNTLHHRAKKTKVEHPSVPGDRDIVVGDESRKANALLNDMVSLHRMIWNSKVEDSSKKRKSRHEAEELAAHLVRLIKEGKAFSSQDTSDTNKFFVPGSSSRFMEQIDHDIWVELSDQRAVQFVADKLLDGYSKTITSNPETEATKGKEEGLNAGLLLMAALATAAADDGGAPSKTNTATTTMKAHRSSSSSPPPSSTLLSEKKQSSAKAVNPKHNQLKRKRNQSGPPDGKEESGGGAIASTRGPRPPRHGFDTDGNIVVTDYDILCGRGEGLKQHEGNVRFRNIVALYRPDYVRASKFQKLEVAKLVVQAILQGHPPSRFLRQDSETGKWIDIGFKRAAEKTSQALREKTAVDERASMRVAADAPGGLPEPQLSTTTENGLQQERLSAATCPPPSNPVPTPATGAIRNAAEAGGRGREKTAGAMKNKTADLSYRFSRSNPPNAVDAAGNILVSDYDILCVQEGEPMIMNHNGNNRFQDITALYYPDYASAPPRERPTVAKAVVHAIRNGNPPSRFLEQCHATGQWIDIGDKRAIERVNQALRHMSTGLDKHDGHSPVFLVASEKAEAAMPNTKLLSPPPTPSSRLATTAATAPSPVGNDRKAETYYGRGNMKQLRKESQCRGSIPVSDRAGSVTNIAEGKKPASGVSPQRPATMQGLGVPAVPRTAARGRGGGAVLGQYVTAGHSSSAKTISSQALSAKAKPESLPMAALQEALRIRWEGFAGTDELEFDKLGMAGPSPFNEAVDGTSPVTALDRQEGSKRSTLPPARKKEKPPELKADNQTTQSFEEKTPSSLADDGAEGSIVLADNDIVCGTGGIADHPHKGNARFQDILALYLSDYVEAPTSRKPGVAKVIVQAIRNGQPPGRFLKKDAATGKWVDIGYKQATENTSLALQGMVAKEESNGDGETKAALAGISGVTRPLAIPRPQAEKAVPPPLLPLSATAAVAVAVNDNRNESRGEGRSRDTQPAYYPPIAPTNTFGQPPPPPLQRIAKTFVGGGMAHPQYGNIRPGDTGLFHRPDFSRASKVSRPTCPPLAKALAARIPPPPPPLVPPPLEDRNKQNSSGKGRTAYSRNQMPGDTTTPGGPNDVAVGQDRSKRARVMPPAMLGPSMSIANLRLIMADQGFIEDAWVRSVAEKAVQGLGQRYLKQPRSARQDCVKPSNFVAKIQKKEGFSTDKGNDRSMPPMLSTEFVDGEGNIIVTDYDILCGRGGRTNNNEGNKRFRDLVSLLRPAYVQASKVEKPKVAKVLVHAILSADPPGRFLRLDAKTGKWVDTGLQRAKEKTSQALREKTVEEREHIRAMASTSDSARQGTKFVPPQPTAYPPPYGMRPPVRIDQRPPPNAVPSAPPPPMWRPAGYPHPQPPGWFPCWR